MSFICSISVSSAGLAQHKRVQAKAFKKLCVLLEYTLMNLNEQELKTICLNAYNAALPGLLACRTDEVTASSQSVKIIGEICTEFADRAVKDAKEH